MTYTVSIVPASTQGGRETTRVLLHDPASPLIRAFYRDPSKAPAEFTSHPNFEAIKGDVATGAGFDFSGSDSVFYIPPPPFHPGEVDTAKFAMTAAANVKQAIEKAPSVKRLLLFSSIGAQHERGVGILKINYHSDKVLQTAAPEVAIVRPGYFQENWAHAFETAKADPPIFYSPITPIDYKIPMVSLADTSQVCARKLLDLSTPLPTRTFVFELYGPRHYSTRDVQAALAEVLGKKVGIAAIEKDQLADFYADKVPAGMVQDMVEYVTGALPGGVMAGEFPGDEHTVWGKVELADALRKVHAA